MESKQTNLKRRHAKWQRLLLLAIVAVSSTVAMAQSKVQGKVVDAILEMGGAAIITADHGNADKMVDEDGKPFTAHTTNPVPFCVIGYDCKLREGGVLADIAPTMLKIMGLEQPAEMDGKSIII